MTMSGHQFEHHVAAILRQQGWQAKVTPGSGDYGVDLILTGRAPEGAERRVAVQVKMFSAPVGPQAVQEVVAGKAVHGCAEAWVVTNSTFTPAATRLATANSVRLVAGTELRAMESRAARTERSDDQPESSPFERRWDERRKQDGRALSLSWAVAVFGSLYLLVVGTGLMSLFSGHLDTTKAVIVVTMIAVPAVVWVVWRYRSSRISAMAEDQASADDPV
jgi:hypothetical protein